jgi:nicotinate-nucleotide pyrophosphorylase (carboxylating)
LGEDGLPPIAEDAARVAGLALAEDGPADVTSEVTVGDRTATGVIEARSEGVLAGSAYVDAVARGCGLIRPDWAIRDGETMAAGQRIATVSGPLRAILRAERPLLNLLQRACGIATLTRCYVEAVGQTGCRVLHTRKTAPGLRALDVRAVLSGGGTLHRVDLSHAVMVKDNHRRGLEASGATLAQARTAALERGISEFQVEVESEAQVRTACAAGATRILVDNQSPSTLREWSALARQLRPGIEVEATGGVTLDTAHAFAIAGADFVSVGALTHSVIALDIALEIASFS